jgi:hypothetical protein
MNSEWWNQISGRRLFVLLPCPLAYVIPVQHPVTRSAQGMVLVVFNDRDFIAFPPSLKFPTSFHSR